MPSGRQESLDHRQHRPGIDLNQSIALDDGVPYFQPLTDVGIRQHHTVAQGGMTIHGHSVGDHHLAVKLGAGFNPAVLADENDPLLRAAR